jgi:hypothetical protein
VQKIETEFSTSSTFSGHFWTVPAQSRKPTFRAARQKYNSAMLDSRINSDPAADFRFALDVMEEDSHLGLDDEFASKLRDILLRRINLADAALSCRRPVTPFRLPHEREKTFA